MNHKKRLMFAAASAVGVFALRPYITRKKNKIKSPSKQEMSDLKVINRDQERVTITFCIKRPERFHSYGIIPIKNSQREKGVRTLLKENFNLTGLQLVTFPHLGHDDFIVVLMSREQNSIEEICVLPFNAANITSIVA